MALTGKLDRINKKSRSGRGLSPMNRELRSAQFMLNTSPSDNHDWQSLSRRLLLSAVRSNYTGEDSLNLALRSISEWNTLERDASAKTRSTPNMEKWQKDLTDLLCEKLNPDTIYIFTKHGMSHYWVTANEPTTEDILHYSDYYLQSTEEFPDVTCDFMVFGLNEIENDMLPEDSIKIVCGE